MSLAAGTVGQSDAGPDKSAATAWATLRRYLEGVRADFAGSVDAVVLTGSLATGGYVPGPGDIDQITILRQDAAPGTEDRLQAGIDSAAAAYGRAVHLAPISGSFTVSSPVETRLTKWCKRFLDWESNHQPDDVPDNGV